MCVIKNKLFQIHTCVIVWQLGSYNYKTPQTRYKYYSWKVNPSSKLPTIFFLKNPVLTICFNHAHSSLRCLIEHTFGVWKNIWRIIKNLPSFPFQFQIPIVSASMVLYNFVRLDDRDDKGFKGANLDSIPTGQHNREASSNYELNMRTLTKLEMVVLRDSIANSI